MDFCKSSSVEYKTIPFSLHRLEQETMSECVGTVTRALSGQCNEPEAKGRFVCLFVCGGSLTSGQLFEGSFQTA